MKGEIEPLAREVIDEAEIVLDKEEIKSLIWLKPVVSVAKFFIGKLSKGVRAEPDQIGIYDKRYVDKLKSKVFGKGQSESGKTINSKGPLPSLQEAQQTALNSDVELQELIEKREKLRQEIKEHSMLIQRRRSKIRYKVKKKGEWKANESLFYSPIFRVVKMGEIRKVGRDMLGKIFKKFTGFHRTNDLVKRMRLKMELEEVTYTVETVTDPDTGMSIRASMDDVGPPDSNLTWSSLANILKLHIEYVIPANRIAKMIGHGYFSSANQCRWMGDTARTFYPIYIELFNQLVDAHDWQGDDTTTKVLDITPSKSSDALHAKIEEELPFEFDRKNGRGKKSKLNVTYVTGRTDADTRSVIRFYRTHLGSFGDLVSELLSRRSPKHKDVIIQGDLSTTNLPKNIYFEKFNIKIAGCGFHARKPFWEERKRIDAAYFFLRCFTILSFIEEDYGVYRFEDPVALRKRTKYARLVWGIILRGALTVVNQKRMSPRVLISYDPVYWPKDSKFYLACQYIINHYDELTLYLTYSELDWTNNHSERSQRKEKLMLNSSFFRKSREGRVILDILKTIMATVQAAQVNFEDYLQFVILNKEDVEKNPELYTPFAFSRKKDEELSLAMKATI